MVHLRPEKVFHNAVVAGAALSSVALLATAALLAPGCTVLTNDALPDDAGPESSPSPTEAGTVTCDDCALQACVGPSAVCFSDPDCLAQHFCTKRTGCSCGTEAGSTEALAKIAAVTQCNLEKSCSQCAMECASTCGDASTSTCGSDAGTDADATTDADADAGTFDAEAGTADAEADAAMEASVPPSVDACMGCVSTKCIEPRNACAAGTACASFLGCVQACKDTACANDCGQRFAEGATKATELSNCTLAGCRGACAL